MFTIRFDDSKCMYTIGSNVAKILRPGDEGGVLGKHPFTIATVLKVNEDTLFITSTHSDIYICKIIPSPCPV